MMARRDRAIACPCGSARGHSVRDYADCCGRYHAGEAAPDAEALMRSRYSAYVLRLAPYLLETWHVSTRPAALDLDAGIKWTGLEVGSHQADGDSATVAFVARYKAGGRAGALRELSRFVREGGRWYYADGSIED